jgi:hypothetical protein
MDEFRDELVTTILGTAHYLWKARFGHLSHLDEPNWKAELGDIFKDAVTDALAEPQRQNNTYRGIDNT